MVDLAAINRKHFVFLNKIVSFVACVIARDVRLSRVDRHTDRQKWKSFAASLVNSHSKCNFCPTWPEEQAILLVSTVYRLLYR